MRLGCSGKKGEEVTRAKDNKMRKKAGDSRENGDVTAATSGCGEHDWPELGQVGLCSRILDGTGAAETQQTGRAANQRGPWKLRNTVAGSVTHNSRRHMEK